MNDPNSPELDQPLEELDAPEVGAAPPAAPAAPAVMPMGPQPAHKQLYQFLWGGVAVLFGCLLPFHKAGAGWSADNFYPLVTGPIGLMTFGGAIVAFAALLFVGAQWYCIKFRRVMLGPIALMACVCAWSWLSFLDGGDAKLLGFKTGGAVSSAEWHAAVAQAVNNEGLRLDDEEVWAVSSEVKEKLEERFNPRNKEEMDEFNGLWSTTKDLHENPKGMVKMLHDGQYISDYFTHIGPGYFFTLAGSTYVMLVFLGAIFGVGQGKKKATPAAAGGGGKGRGGRRR